MIELRWVTQWEEYKDPYESGLSKKVVRVLQYRVKEYPKGIPTWGDWLTVPEVLELGKPAEKEI